MLQTLRTFIGLAALCLILLACKKDSVRPDPTIASFTPTSSTGGVGYNSILVMTITGTNFSTNASEIEVYLEDYNFGLDKNTDTDAGFRYPLTIQAGINAPTETQIVAGADLTGKPYTYYKVVVRVAGKEVTSVDDFEYQYPYYYKAKATK